MTVTDDESTGFGEGEKTAMIEMPSHDPGEGLPPSSEETMALDASDLMEVNSKPRQEATMLIDVANLSAHASAKADAVDEPRRPPPVSAEKLLDADRAKRFPWERLQRVAEHQCRGLDELFAALPPEPELASVTEAVQQRMEELVGSSHQVRWNHAGAAITSGRGIEFGNGVWTWGRVPPDHHRLVAGVQRRLADAWIAAADAEDRAGDEFEFGMVSYLVAEFCARWCEQVGWPAWSWAVNPMARRDLETMLLAGESPLLELTFDVQLQDAGGGALRLWIPMGVVRKMKESVRQTVRQGASGGRQWWTGLPIERPMIAGVAGLRKREWENLRIGDVVIAERHGVDVGAAKASAADGAARWMVGSNRAVSGRLVDGNDDGWKFVVTKEQVVTECEEAEVSDDTEEGPEALGVAVETAEVELEFRLGEVQMEVADLARLRPGQVVDCQQPLGSPVELVVRGASVGRGELVSVDGRLGVRILGID